MTFVHRAGLHGLLRAVGVRPAAPPAAAGPHLAEAAVAVAAPAARTLLDAIELVEAEVESAAASCARQSDRALAQLHNVAGIAAHILVESHEVATAAAAASANVTAVAAAGEELSAAGREIAEQAARSAAAGRRAVDDSEAAASAMATLAGAADAIGEVVRTIAAIAARTNLLALNATIEAARAGEAGRGFAIVAAEVKELSRQTATATQQISQRITGMQHATRGSVAAIRQVGEAVAGIDAASAAVAAAVEQQEATIRQVAERLRATAGETDRVALSMTQVAADGTRVREAASAAQLEATAMASTVEALRGDLTLQLRRGETAATALPLAMEARLRLGSKEYAATVLDMSPTDALVRLPPEIALPHEARVQLHLPGLGTLEGTLADSSRGRVVVALASGSVGDGVRQRLDQISADCAHFGAGVRAYAAEIANALAAALSGGALTAEALFDTNYQAVADSDPPQFITKFTQTADRLVRPVLDRALAFDDRVVGVFVVDRNGYTATHNSNVSQPQRRGDPLWNARHCRNRRMFNDRAGIAGGRTTRATLVQCYERDMGGGQSMTITEADAPIFAAGRHWGGLRMMYRPTM
jgi:hypothetical protein